MSGVVLDPGAESRFLHHFHIKVGTFRNSLSLDQLVLAFKVFHLLLHLFQNGICRMTDLLLRYYIMRCRKNRCMAFHTFDLTCKHINICDTLDLISEKLHPYCPVRRVRRKDLQYITPDTEGSTVKIHLISCVLDINQLFDNLITVPLHPRTKRNHHVKKFLRRTQAVDTGYRRNHYHILTLT